MCRRGRRRGRPEAWATRPPTGDAARTGQLVVWGAPEIRTSPALVPRLTRAPRLATGSLARGRGRLPATRPAEKPADRSPEPLEAGSLEGALAVESPARASAVENPARVPGNLAARRQRRLEPAFQRVRSQLAARLELERLTGRRERRPCSSVVRRACLSGPFEAGSCARRATRTALLPVGCHASALPLRAPRSGAHPRGVDAFSPRLEQQKRDWVVAMT